MREEQILINGLKTNYKIAGSGPAILILHGWNSFSERWQNVQELLAKAGYAVIVPDLPGFGKSGAPETAWDLNNYVKWLNDFSESCPELTGGFFLLGHSFGGRIAIKFSVKYPQKFKKLILCASAGIKHKKNLPYLLVSFIARIGNYFSFFPFFSFFRKVFYKFIVRKKDYLVAQGIIKDIFKKAIEEDLTPYLSFVNVPTLIIWGKKDQDTPLKDAYLMKKLIPRSDLEILPEAGHRLNIEVPEKLSEIIIRLIKS